MARPYKLYKGEKVVTNVYGSELASWFADGWSLEKVTAKPKAKSEPKPATKKAEPAPKNFDRKAELEAMNWRDLKAIATKLGLEKEDDQNWDDLIPEILIKEDR